MRTSRLVDKVVVPVLEVIGLPVDGVVEHEIVVGPFQAGTQADGGAIDLHVLIVVEHLIIIGGVRVGLAGEVGRNVEGCRLLAGQPGFHEIGREGRVVRAVGLETQGERLRIAERDGTPGFLAEEVGRGEVVETHAHRTHEHAVAPATREFELAVGLLLHVVGDVDGIVGGIRNQAVALGRVDGVLRVEVAHRGDLTHGAFEIGLAVQIARTREDGAADHLLVGNGVAVDDDVVEGGGLALDDAHLDVDGIAFDGQFHRRDVEEEEAVVTIELADGNVALLLAGIQALVHRHHVVDIPLLDAEDLVEHVFGIFGVTCPGDVAEIVFLPLVDLEMDTQASVFRIAEQRITDNLSITVACFVEDFEHLLLVAGILAFLEFFR